TDAHIHTGIPLSRMVGAAELLRYTSTQTPALAWTDADTAMFTANLVLPVVQTFNSCDCRFMNQHLYTTIAAMSGAIFAENRDEYNKTVEWFTVNKSALDQGQTGSIKQLFRLVTRDDLSGETVTPRVQHVEMGRDQAHGAGDLTNAEILARLIMGQGTKVDPVEGTVSSAADAVGPYEFLGDRILDAAEQFGSFMTGYEIPWVPTAAHTDAAGNPTIVYKTVSGSYRGRDTQNTWELYYYYQYARGVDMAQRAPNFTKFFKARTGYSWDGVDGGGDYWIAIPKEAGEGEGASNLVNPLVDPTREVEDRVNLLDSQGVVVRDPAASYVRLSATPEGRKIAVFGYGYGATYYALRVRTNGMASMDLYGTSYALPDTHGQWRYVILPGNVNDFMPLTFSGNGTTVDVDHINVKASTLLTPPAFSMGAADQTFYSYAGTTQTSNLDFSATDPGAGESLSYEVEQLPPGATFNAATGAFSWKPAQAGTFSFFVEVSDGTTVTVKKVTFVVDADRQAAVGRASAPYKAGTAYVESTLPAYNAAYADMMSVIGSASDDVYFQKLATLRSAAAGLREVNPLLADGSLDFSNMLVSSDLGSPPSVLVDNNQDSATGFGPNLTFTMDFGPNFKISANDFKTRTINAFPERTGGVAMFGSNDKENWTRLTPGLSIRTDAMQDMPVADELKNAQFRFLRMQMIDPYVPPYQPVAILQMSELRIFGTRYPTLNKIATVGLASPQALRSRVINGDTVKLNFVSTEPINSVVATIQGQPATVTTTDNLNWTANWVVSAAAPAGKVNFVLNYKTAAGVNAEPAIFTTDNSALNISDQSNLINNVTSIASVTDSNGRNAVDATSTANLLFDANLVSVPDYRLNGSGNGSWVEFDFRNGGTVNLSRVEMIARQDQYASRINGAIVQGSNDNSTWDNITNAAGNTVEWQTLTVANPTPYRYLRVINGNQWFGNMAELRLYGVTKSSLQIASASLSTTQTLSPAVSQNKRIVPGAPVTLKFVAKAPINAVAVTIAGQAAAVTTTDNINFTATATVPQGAAPGNVGYTVNYKQQDGTAGFPNTATTDGSGLYLVDEADLIRNVTTVATLIDSSTGRTAATTKAIVDSLFDSNIGSASDFRLGSSSCVGGYVVFDFKNGNQVNLSSIELLARQDQLGRAKGIVFQGSNDGTTFTNLTNQAAGIADWQTFAVGSAVPYRYVRIINANSWCGNMAEVRLHGSLHAADVAAPVTTATTNPAMPASGWFKGDVTVNLAAVDASGATSYYKVDGGAQQSGGAVALSAKGSHTVSYWSVDQAGNVEAARTLAINIGPVDLGASVQMTQKSATLNRATGKYTGGVIITNTSGAPLEGPLKLKLSNMASGLVLDNATGVDGSGAPYVGLSGVLAAGASVTVNLVFSNPNRVPIGYATQFFRGDL
ncbi:MAG: discoidin domain-containing protein, partial [Massilia sp.]